MAHRANSIATPERVQEAAEAMLAEGYPIEKVSQSAIRTRLGGGSMTTIHRHLKPLLEEKRTCIAGQEAAAAEQPEYDPAHVPETARHLLDGMKSSADELGRVVVQLLDEAVTDERHRQELVRTKEHAEHRRVADDLQYLLDSVRYDLEQTADESAAYQEQFDDARATLDTMEVEAAEMRKQAAELDRQLLAATARAVATERDAAQAEARVAVLEKEIRHARDTLALAEDRADRAEQRADDADKARAAAERRAHAAARAKPVRATRARRAGPGSLGKLGVDPAKGRRLRKPRGIRAP